MKLVLTAASAGVATACLANAAHRGGMAAVGAGRFFYQIGAKRDFVTALQEGNSATRNAAIALVSTAVGVYFVAAAFIIQTVCE